MKKASHGKKYLDLFILTGIWYNMIYFITNPEVRTTVAFGPFWLFLCTHLS